MSTFVTLIKWTDQGVRNVKDTTKRYRQALALVEKMGVKERSIFWTIGQYDIVFIVDAPDQETVAAAMLAVASKGNVRTEILPAYSVDEVEGILKKMP